MHVPQSAAEARIVSDRYFPEIIGNSAGNSKAISEMGMCEFESSQVSQPLWSLFKLNY
jgi:hypothetical protein